MPEKIKSLPLYDLIFFIDDKQMVIPVSSIHEILYDTETKVYTICLYQTLSYKIINFIQKSNVQLKYNNSIIQFQFEKLGLSINNFIPYDYPYWKLILFEK